MKSVVKLKDSHVLCGYEIAFRYKVENVRHDSLSDNDTERAQGAPRRYQ